MVVNYQLCPSRLFSLVPLFLGLITSLSLTNAINTAQAYWQYAIANSNVCTSLIYWREEQRLSIFYHCDSETQKRLEKITFTNYKSFGGHFMKKRQTFVDKKTEIAAKAHQNHCLFSHATVLILLKVFIVRSRFKS